MASECKKDYCEPYAEGVLKTIKNAVDITKHTKKGQKLSKRFKKDYNKTKKKLINSCEIESCNPGCKGTLFEKGNPNVLPKSLKLLKGLKSSTKKMVKKMVLQTRKKLFGKKKDILKDNFYEKLSVKNVNKTKKKGAISGCTIMIM
jgi:hypothetical protein